MPELCATFEKELEALGAQGYHEISDTGLPKDCIKVMSDLEISLKVHRDEGTLSYIITSEDGTPVGGFNNYAGVSSIHHKPAGHCKVLWKLAVDRWLVTDVGIPRELDLH